MMRVLVACEYSAIVRDAFRAKGHHAISVDLLPTEGDPDYHIQGSVLDYLDDGWDMMIAHPPCTYLTNAGVRHLHDHVASRNGVRAKVSGQERWEAMREGAEFFMKLYEADIPKIAVENPIPHKYAKEIIGQYHQLIQPWHFGHKQTKATCLWLKNLPPLISTDIVGPPPRGMSQEEKRSWHAVHYTSPGKDRAKKRSRFFEGIAAAMAEQWGSDDH